jgi:hypothetical protein
MNWKSLDIKTKKDIKKEKTIKFIIKFITILMLAVNALCIIYSLYIEELLFIPIFVLNLIVILLLFNKTLKQ